MNDRILQFVNYFAAKDRSGKTMKVGELNVVLPSVNDMLYSAELRKLIVGKVQEIPMEALSISPTRVFKKETSLNVADDGRIDLPSDYVRYCAIRTNYDGFKRVEIVSDETYVQRQGNVLYRPEIKPYGYILDSYALVIPWDIGSVSFVYLRKSKVPFFDYAIDKDTYEEVYLPVGTYLTYDAVSDSCNLIQDTGTVSVVLRGNLTKQNVVGRYDSLSVEFEWIMEEMFTDIVYTMLSAVGMNIDKQDITKLAEGKLNG